MVSAAFRKLADGFFASLMHQRWEWRLLGWLGGLLLYLTLPVEPPVWLAPVAAIVALVGMGRGRSGGRSSLGGSVLAGLLLAGALGMGYADWVTHRLPPPIPHAIEDAWITGELRQMEERQHRRIRLLLEEVRLPDGRRLPGRVRLSLRQGAASYLRVGDGIRLKAMLYPPSPPPLPGAFDLARHLFFQQVVATGYAVSGVEILPGDQEPSVWRLHLWQDHARDAIRQKLIRHLPGEASAVARALLLGEQQVIPEALNEAYRKSGLAHLLSISGLHMAMVAWLAFVLLRRLMCLSPIVALQWPTQKIAALLAWLVSGGYLWVADAPVSAQRAWLMTALVCLAILLGRPVTGLRLLAVAAFAVTLVNPGAVLGPGFQLSFLAVLALMTAYPGRGGPDKTHSDIGWLNGLYRGIRGLGRAVLASVAILLMTAPVTLHHFQQLSWMSCFANLPAIPLTNILVMPGLLLGLAVPAGLAGPVFSLTASAIDSLNSWAVWTAQLAARLPLSIPSLEGWAVLLVVLIWVVAALLRQPLAWVLALTLLLSLPLWGRWNPPQLVANARHLVWRDGQGQWQLMALESDRPKPGFLEDIWRQRLGAQDWGTRPPDCDAAACRWQWDGQWGRLSVEWVQLPEALLESCRRADLVLVTENMEPLPEDCTYQRLTPDAGIALWPEKQGWRRWQTDTIAHRRWYARPSPMHGRSKQDAR